MSAKANKELHWSGYKWNRLSHWAVVNKVQAVIQRAVKSKNVHPGMLRRSRTVVERLRTLGLIIHTRYGHLVPGSESEFFDVVNPVLWKADVGSIVVELDAELRLHSV